MREDKSIKQSPDAKKSQSSRGFDPVLVAWTNSRSVSNIFLKNGESLRFTQRVRVIIVSLMITCLGIYFGADALDEFRAGGLIGLCFAGISLPLLILGVLGLEERLTV